VWLVFGLIQPILYLAFFGPLLEKYLGGPGDVARDSWQVFVPGLLVQLGLFGSTFVGFGIIAEWRAGRRQPGKRGRAPQRWTISVPRCRRLHLHG
jgi:ABC-2 type transport system permease protein